jgi:hypothetical protein
MLPEKALLSDFEEDIFISYDHDDNEPPIPELKGFVDRVDEYLNVRLTHLIGERPKIWKDHLMRGNEVINDTLVIRLSKTAFLVCILTPAYLKSKYCPWELKEFYEAVKNRGFKINNRSRIFKVIKTPCGPKPDVDPFEKSDLPDDLRHVFRESLGYQFFEYDTKGKLREFWPEYGPEYLRKYLEKLEDLAQDISAFIKDDQDTRKCVYLAETTPELANDRNEIKRALQQHGYRVLPDESLPFEDEVFEQKISEYLKHCTLSIHLIGADFTTIETQDETQHEEFDLKHRFLATRVRKQHELAMRRGENDPDYSRMVWMPAGLTPQDELNQDFLVYLQNDPAVQENAEVLTGAKLEDLKTIIQKKLKITWQASSAEVKGKRIYLYCDMKDRDAVIPIKNYLQEQNYEVLLPFNDADYVCKAHTENVRLCDAILILYGSFNTMEFKLPELKKINVNRSKRPLSAHGIFVVGPETPHKTKFDTHETLVMKCFGDFSPDCLKPFLKQLDR